jgi:hypothetical protein
MNTAGVIPETCRPESVQAVLAELEEARNRLDETGQQLAEAHRVSTAAKRQANSMLVGQGGVTKEQWDAAQTAWHTAQGDLELVRQVHTAARSELRATVVRLADVVLEKVDTWRADLERAWLRLDAQAVKRLEAFRAIEAERGEVAAAHQWLINLVETDAVAAIEGRPRYGFRPGPARWLTQLRGPNREPLGEQAVLDTLDALLATTAMQRRLDYEAAAASEREAQERALREQREYRLEEARRRQQDRLRAIGVET